MSELTQNLNAAGPEARAANELLSLVYEELRQLAAKKMASEAPGQTLQATALVHEAWLRLTKDDKQKWNDRTHFFAAAAEAMRRILVDNARRKRAQRHGGQLERVEIPEIASPLGQNEDQVLAVSDALAKLALQDKQKAELVKLRYFVGMTTEEAAEVLGIFRSLSRPSLGLRARLARPGNHRLTVKREDRQTAKERQVRQRPDCLWLISVLPTLPSWRGRTFAIWSPVPTFALLAVFAFNMSFPPLIGFSPKSRFLS